MRKPIFTSALVTLALLSGAETLLAQTTVFQSEGTLNFKFFLQKYAYSFLAILIPLIASLSLLTFFWGLAKFIWNASGDKNAIKDGKNLMIYGTLALFAMVSVWGILRFAYNDLGFNLDRPFGIPFLPEGAAK